MTMEDEGDEEDKEETRQDSWGRYMSNITRYARPPRGARGTRGASLMGVPSNLLCLVVAPRSMFQFTSTRLASMLSASVPSN